MSRLTNLRKFAISLAMFAVVALGSAVVANADSVIINVPNAGLSGTPGPYATVNYVLNGSNIDVTVTMFPGFAAFGTGAANNGIFGFNVVGSTAGLNITGLPAGWAFNPAGGQMDGFGNFDVTLSCCNPPGVTSFSFTIAVQEDSLPLVIFSSRIVAGFTSPYISRPLTGTRQALPRTESRNLPACC